MPYWSLPLTAPIVLDNDTKILTLSDALQVYLALPVEKRNAAVWMNVNRLLKQAAETASTADIASASAILRVAIVIEGLARV